MLFCTKLQTGWQTLNYSWIWSFEKDSSGSCNVKVYQVITSIWNTVKSGDEAFEPPVITTACCDQWVQYECECVQNRLQNPLFFLSLFCCCCFVSLESRTTKTRRWDLIKCNKFHWHTFLLNNKQSQCLGPWNWVHFHNFASCGTFGYDVATFC